MPCFSTGPIPGTPEYEAWLPDVRRKLNAFTHVVDYYYRKAGMAMPEPTAPDGAAEPPPASGAGADDNARVLHQILLHLDCDDVDVFHLNEIRNLLMVEDRTPRGRGYLSVLEHCFQALRNGFRDRPTTGAMWAECRDPALMLDHLRGRVTERKLRLFAVACCRRVPHLLTDERSLAAVEMAERYAEGVATAEDLAAAGNRAQELGELRGYYGPVAAWAAAPSAQDAARYAAWNAFCDRNGLGEELVQTALLRCIVGNPFRPVILDPARRTAAVTSLAQAAYQERILPGGELDAQRLAVLADALEEAGCTEQALLDHLRCPGPHVRGCWPVDLLLGKG